MLYFSAREGSCATHCGPLSFPELVLVYHLTKEVSKARENSAASFLDLEVRNMTPVWVSRARSPQVCLTGRPGNLRSAPVPLASEKLAAQQTHFLLPPGPLSSQPSLSYGVSPFGELRSYLQPQLPHRRYVLPLLECSLVYLRPQC